MIDAPVTNPPTSVLVVSPDTARAAQLTRLLGQEGAESSSSTEIAEALDRLEKAPADIMMADVDLPSGGALRLVTTAAERWPGLPVIVFAEEAATAAAEAMLGNGAADVLTVPFDVEQLRYVLGKSQAAVKSMAVRPPPPPSSEQVGLLGQSVAMRQLQGTLQRAAQGTVTVLIRGESGTGKELVARAIHEASPRTSERFVKIDCTALPENLLEGELFGYEKGAFTGAVTKKPGRVELADKGTLFLDEIGELSLPLQAKLLRLLQDKQFERLGGTKTIQVDVRIVAATHRDLESMIERGQFRLDLFYRLNVVPLWLPPLRARRDDIELLAQHFCRASGAANGRPRAVLADEALKFMRNQRWPGNVRQLQNFVERLVVLSSEDVITLPAVLAELSQPVTFQTQPSTMEPMTLAPAPSSYDPESHAEGAVLSLQTALKSAEKRAIERALRIANGNRSLAARLLNLSRSTLYTKLQEHGLL